jgi:hypothetical protein
LRRRSEFAVRLLIAVALTQSVLSLALVLLAPKGSSVLSQKERGFGSVRPSLPTRGVVGFAVLGADTTESWYLAQYALAPLVLDTAWRSRPSRPVILYAPCLPACRIDPELSGGLRRAFPGGIYVVVSRFYSRF